MRSLVVNATAVLSAAISSIYGVPDPNVLIFDTVLPDDR